MVASISTWGSDDSSNIFHAVLWHWAVNNGSRGVGDYPVLYWMHACDGVRDPSTFMPYGPLNPPSCLLPFCSSCSCSSCLGGSFHA